MLISSQSQAYNICSNPGIAPPEFFNFSKPSHPNCIDWENKTHSCDSRTFEYYKSKVNKYNFEKNIYVKNLEKYLDNVLDFIDCEIERI